MDGLKNNKVLTVLNLSTNYIEVKKCLIKKI